MRMCRSCCAPCNTGEARFKVFGCTPSGGSPIQIAGASVVVKLGGTTVATVTSGSTVFIGTGTILVPGTYDVTVDFNRYNHYATTVTISPACNQVDTTINLIAPAGMICCSALGGKLVPATLHWTDSNGTWDLVWNTSLLRWIGCGHKSSVVTTQWILISGTSTCSALTVDIPYVIVMLCAGTVTVGWKTVEPCSGSNWNAAASLCDATAATAQPTFEANGLANPTRYQTGGGTVPGAAVLGNVPITGTLGALTGVADGGGHAGVAASAPVTGGFAYAE